MNFIKRSSSRLSFWANLLCAMAMVWFLAHSPPTINALTIIRLLALIYSSYVLSFYVERGARRVVKVVTTFR